MIYVETETCASYETSASPDECSILKLAHGATVYGTDASIILHADGRAELHGYTDEIDGLADADGLVEVLTEIGLVPFLRNKLDELDQDFDDYEQRRE